MPTGFDLDRYLTESVESIVKDALSASLKNPKETAFLLSYALAGKRAAALRATHAAQGRHIPSFLIASITNRCNLHCAGCYARANSLCDDAEAAALLTDEDWCRIFDEAAQIGVSFCLLAGGEPMLRRGVLVTLVLVGLTAAAYWTLLGPATLWIGRLPLALQCLAIAGCIAPVSFALGIPFSLGLRALDGDMAEFTPMAWGINGAFSVIASPLTSILALRFGYDMVILLAFAIYAIVWMTFPGSKPSNA